MNLVVNARDAMPSGGEVRVATRTCGWRGTCVRDRAVILKGDYVVIEVADSGHGIPEGKLNKIFEPFFTTKQVGEGTGLGLSTAYGIVKQTGGFIFADSPPGQGATFTIYLPAYDKVETAPAPEARGAAAAGSDRARPRAPGRGRGSGAVLRGAGAPAAGLHGGGGGLRRGGARDPRRTRTSTSTSCSRT